jgi:hypothetical protein
MVSSSGSVSDAPSVDEAKTVRPVACCGCGGALPRISAE